jgi:hypothetical protein
MARRKATHIAVYDREAGWKQTACGYGKEWMKANPKLLVGQRPTCNLCKAYIVRTGNGPEQLKGLLRF